MEYFFNSCSKAVENAVNTNRFGLYYSETQTPTSDIHIHDCCEVLLCLSGGKNFLIDGKIYDVNERDLFLINQYEAHKISFEEGCVFSRYVLEIHPELLYRCSTETTDLSKCFYIRNDESSNRFTLSQEQCDTLCNMFENIKNNQGYAKDIMNYSELMKILVFINKIFNKHQSDPDAKPYNNATQKVIDYINNNYQTSTALSLDSLSKHTFMSVNQLCRIFKKDTGTTISKYILSKRISEAKKLLARGKSVTEVSEACGFGDYSSFIRAFSKNAGVSPGKYFGKSDKNNLHNY